MNDKIRLLDIISLVEPGKKVIDIGTDHGLVPLYLVKNGISDDILATDISAHSLQKTIDLIQEENMDHIIKTMHTDGFDGIEVASNQIAIIAGMGGNTIIDIIDANIDFARSLDYMILASNIATERLRSYLMANNFAIKRDFLSYENGKYYDILKVYPNEPSSLDLAEIYYGFENIEDKSKLLKAKLEMDLDKNLKFRDDILKNSTNRQGLARIDERLKAINEVYDKWKLDN